MELIEHIVFHSIEDTLPLVPFLFITYLVLEALEHMAGDRAGALVRRAGAAGPVIGAVLGIVPQCGFSAMGATLYAGRVITLGTLAAVFLSTSDEMLPLLVAEQVDAATVVQILLVKAVIAAVVGLAVDACLRALRKNARAHEALRRGVLGQAAGASSGAPDLIDELSEAGEGAGHIHRLCERDHCGCEDAEPNGADRASFEPGDDARPGEVRNGPRRHQCDVGAAFGKCPDGFLNIQQGECGGKIRCFLPDTINEWRRAEARHDGYTRDYDHHPYKVYLLVCETKVR